MKITNINDYKQYKERTDKLKVEIDSKILQTSKNHKKQAKNFEPLSILLEKVKTYF